MMVALAAIFTKYWQNEERVPFPLHTVFRPLVDIPESGKGRIPHIFRNRAFLLGCAIIFLDTHRFINFLRMIPLSLRSLAAMYFGGHLSVWLGSGQRLCIGAAASQAMAINSNDDVPGNARCGGMFMLVISVSLICGWLLILAMTYHYSEPPDGNPIEWWGRLQFMPGEDLLIDTVSGTRPADPAEHLPALITGGLLVIAFYCHCQFVPGWPIHPAGLLGAGTWCVGQIWPNVFFGWLIKKPAYEVRRIARL